MLRFLSALISILLIATACSSAGSGNDYANELEGAVLSPPRELEDFYSGFDGG